MGVPVGFCARVKGWVGLGEEAAGGEGDDVAV